MAITKEKKQEVLTQLSDILDSATSLVFVGFRGLSVGESTEMRRSLKDEDVTYLVAKKRLVKKAIADKGMTGDIPELPGELAIAYTTSDPTASARNIHSHAKKHEGLSILGGIFEEKLIDATAMQEIATIPPVEVLRGMFVNVINSPIQGLAVALNAIAEKKESTA